MSIEIKLANGRTITVETGKEAADFVETYGGPTPLIKEGSKPPQIYVSTPLREKIVRKKPKEEK